MLWMKQSATAKRDKRISGMMMKLRPRRLPPTPERRNFLEKSSKRQLNFWELNLKFMKSMTMVRRNQRMSLKSRSLPPKRLRPLSQYLSLLSVVKERLRRLESISPRRNLPISLCVSLT